MAVGFGLQGPAYAQAANCSLPVSKLPVGVFKQSNGSMLPTIAAGQIVGAQCYTIDTRTDPNGAASINDVHPPVNLGDIVVFHVPSDPSEMEIKRVVGMPGDTIQMKAAHLILDGYQLPRQPDGDFNSTEDTSGQPIVLHRYTETLPNGVRYDILQASDDGLINNTNVYHVPPGYIFVMGDNRDDSLDSRMLEAVGYIPLDDLVGKVLQN